MKTICIKCLNTTTYLNKNTINQTLIIPIDVPKECDFTIDRTNKTNFGKTEKELIEFVTSIIQEGEIKIVDFINFLLPKRFKHFVAGKLIEIGSAKFYVNSKHEISAKGRLSDNEDLGILNLIY